MNKINVAGLGPGNKDYILPVVYKIIKESDVIISGKRNLRYLDVSGKMIIEIRNNINEIIDFIKKNKSEKKICIAVSGDPGFYSILGSLKKHFSENDLNILPGISSFQYMFSKIGRSWENFYLTSIHGKDCDIVDLVKKQKNIFFLTDKKKSFKKICEILDKNCFGEKIVFVGNNLSYGDEKIISGKAKDLKDSNFDFELAVVVVTDE